MSRGEWPRWRPRTCEACGDMYEPTYARQRTCGRSCGVWLRRFVTFTLSSGRSCRVRYARCACGRLLTTSTQSTRDTCSFCTAVAAAALHQQQIDKAGARVKALYAIARAEGCGHRQWRRELIQLLVDRDGSDCGLCREPVVASRGGRSPSSATIDHKVARSRGGADAMSNLHVVHWQCNRIKGTHNLDEVIPDFFVAA